MAVTKEDKIRAKREKLKTLGTGFGSNEPVIDAFDYTASLMKALNYYNASNDNKDKRKWFLSYIGKTKASKIELTVPDFEFRSVGTIARLKSRDQYLSENELAFLESEYDRLVNFVKQEESALKKVVKKDKPNVSIQDRMYEAATEHAGEFNHMIDEFLTKDIVPNFSAYLEANNVSGAVAKIIAPEFNSLWNEMQELLEGEDKQLIEGYSHIKKTKIKKLCAILVDLENACNQRSIVTKVARPPRARKEKPASVLASKIKYMKENAELGLTSIKPEKIVGAKEVLVYNTKTKKIFVYRAFGEAALTVKGASIANFDVATSSCKTMRKPENVKDFVGMTKKGFATAFNALTTKEAAVTGRMGEDCIIVKVF